MRGSRFGSLLIVALLAAACCATLSASPITSGSFDFSGTVYVTTPKAAPVVTPGGTCPTGLACIFWTDPTAAVVGKVDISASGLPNGDIPVGISGNLAANISSLQNGPDIVGAPGFTAQTFMTFNNGGITTVLMINFIEPGIESAAACGLAAVSGQHCTLPGSLFNFTNNPPPAGGTACGQFGCQATATWSVDGVTSGNPGAQEAWSANFTSQFPLGIPYQTVFNLLNANGFVSNTYSATLTLIPNGTTPEPPPSALMGLGLGLVVLAAGLRRRLSSR